MTNSNSNYALNISKIEDEIELLLTFPHNSPSNSR